MLRHYLTITRRLITRQRAYFLINSSGLVLGLAAVLLAFVYIRDETGYDRFHQNYERIFRLNKWVVENTGERVKTAETGGLYGPTLVEELPGVEAAVRLAPWWDDVLVSYEDRHVNVAGWTFADSNFFEVFDFGVLRGDPASALAAPGQVMLTPGLAEALFGKEDPIGKSIQGQGDRMYTVSGIVAPPPRNSHIQFEVLASWSSTRPGAGFLEYSFMNNWIGQTVYTYLLLGDPARAAAVDAKLAAFTTRHMAANRADSYAYYLQPLKEVYLYSYDIKWLRGNKYGSALFLRTFSIIALLILLIAGFNYVNISTARSLERAREVGVKKVLGARRGQLLGQFLTETFVFVAIAAVVALVLANHLLPRMNDLFGHDIPVSILVQPSTLLFLAATVALTSLGAGFFPGAMLAAFRPVTVLHGQGKNSPGGDWPRQVLTTLQLALSVGLIAGTLLLNRQFRFLLDRDLGFDKDQVLVMNAPPGIRDNVNAYYNTLTANPGIESVAICQAAVGTGTFGTTVIPKGANDQAFDIQAFRVDTNFVRTYGIEMAAGRFFSARFPADTGAVVINEEFARLRGWDDPLGKTIQFSPGGARAPIIGVVRDFHYSSLHQSLGPLVMWLDGRRHNISVRLDPRNAAATLAFLERTWKAFEPRYPFGYFFVDQEFAKSYNSEQRMVRNGQEETAKQKNVKCKTGT